MEHEVDSDKRKKSQVGVCYRIQISTRKLSENPTSTTPLHLVGCLELDSSFHNCGNVADANPCVALGIALPLRRRGSSMI